jgi:hypothetical protein
MEIEAFPMGNRPFPTGVEAFPLGFTPNPTGVALNPIGFASFPIGIEPELMGVALELSVLEQLPSGNGIFPGGFWLCRWDFRFFPSAIRAGRAMNA